MVRPTRREFLLGGAAGVSLLAGTAVALSRVRTAPPLDVSSTAAPPPSRQATRRRRPTTSSPDPTTSTRSAAGPTSSSTTLGSGAAATSAGTLRMVCRDAWGAAPPTRQLPRHSIDRITLHHTGVRLDDLRQGTARVRGHQRYHQSRGFSDIAYHLVIDGRGTVYEGRAFDQPGETFTAYDPRGHFLVTLEGNFDDQALPPAQHDAMLGAVRWAMTEFGVPIERVASHRQLTPTTCPGAAVHALVADGTLAQQVAGTSPVTLERWCGPEAEAHLELITTQY